MFFLLFRFNGQAVPGSPFSCKVSPGNTQPRVPVSGSGIELAAVGVPAEIKIEGISGKNFDIFYDPKIYIFSYYKKRFLKKEILKNLNLMNMVTEVSKKKLAISRMNN